jgi:hypothetical protein
MVSCVDLASPMHDDRVGKPFGNDWHDRFGPSAEGTNGWRAMNVAPVTSFNSLFMNFSESAARDIGRTDRVLP